MAVKSLTFPDSKSGLAKTQNFAISRTEGAYFQIYSKSDMDFGYIPLEFLQVGKTFHLYTRKL